MLNGWKKTEVTLLFLNPYLTVCPEGDAVRGHDVTQIKRVRPFYGGHFKTSS